MSDLSQLIEIAKNIEKQNTEIIRLLKKIAGEDKKDDMLSKYKELLQYDPDLGELYVDHAKIEEKKAKDAEAEIVNDLQIGTLLENTIDVGEVYFLENLDIFKLTVKNNEINVDNLTGSSEASDFTLQELVANESIKNNLSLDDSIVILTSKQSENLPETLRVCVEQGAKKIILPLTASSQLLGAPQNLMNIIKFDFYKNEEHLIEKLFKT